MLKKLSTVGYAAALATAPAWVTACSAQPSAQPEQPSVLFSLTADSMHFEDPNGANVTLVMDGVDPHTIWFTDRPTRESGAISTTKLAGEWGKDGTFVADPPNAALVLHEPVTVDDGQAETLVAEVQDATYDPASASFRAALRVLSAPEASQLDGNLSAHGGRHDLAWPSTAGAVSLFIDSVSLDAVTSSDAPSPDPGTAAATTAAATAATTAAATPSASASASASVSASTATPSATTASPSGAATTATPSLVPKTATPTVSPSRVSPTRASAAIKLCTNPSTCNNTTTNVTYNQTIYFQVSINQSVT